MISLKNLLTDLENRYLDHPAVVGRVRYLIGLLPYEGGHEWAALELPGLLDLCSLADQRCSLADEDSMDYCYDPCDRVTKWDGEVCTECGRQWGYEFDPNLNVA